MAQTLKSLPAVQETRIRSLGQEDALEKERATHSCILACQIPSMEEPGKLNTIISGNIWIKYILYHPHFTDEKDWLGDTN